MKGFQVTLKDGKKLAVIANSYQVMDGEVKFLTSDDSPPIIFEEGDVFSVEEAKGED